jgi:hypothetical protein
MSRQAGLVADQLCRPLVTREGHHPLFVLSGPAAKVGRGALVPFPMRELQHAGESVHPAMRRPASPNARRRRPLGWSRLTRLGGSDSRSHLVLGPPCTPRAGSAVTCRAHHPKTPLHPADALLDMPRKVARAQPNVGCSCEPHCTGASTARPHRVAREAGSMVSSLTRPLSSHRLRPAQPPQRWTGRGVQGVARGHLTVSAIALRATAERRLRRLSFPRAQEGELVYANLKRSNVSFRLRQSG